MTGATHSIIQSHDVSTLQRIIDEIPCAIFILNTNGIIIECSKTALSLFHMDKSDLIIGKNPEIISPPFQRNGKKSTDEIKKWILMARQEGSATFYWEHKRMNGETFPAKVTLSHIQYEGEICILATVVDNTGNALKEETEALTNGNPYALIELNPDLTIADVNPAFSRISGYIREEWISRHLSDFTIIRRDGPTVDEAIKERKTVSGRIIVQFPTGIKHMEYSYIPVCDSHGEIVKIYDIFADHTDMVEKLIESETLIAENPTSIIITNLNGNFLQFNKSFMELTSIPEERLRTMNLANFKLLSREGALFSDALSSKKPEKGTMVVDFGDRIKVLEYTYLPVLDVNNAIQKVICVYNDLTDLKIYVEENKTFISENPYAIFTMNLDLQLTDVNPAFSKLSGYTTEELLRMKLTDFKVIRRDGPGVADAIKSGKLEGGKLIVQFPVGIRHVDYFYIPIKDPRGNIHKVIEIFLDRTDLVEQLHESHTLISENPTSIITTDLNGNFLQFNKSFMNLTSIPEERLRTMNLADFKLLSRNGSTFSDVLSSKKPENGTMVVDFGDRIKVLEYTYLPVLDVNDAIQKVLCVYNDLTDLKTYIEENKTFVSENPYAIFTLNLDLEITDVNPAFSKLSGYSADQLLKMRIQDFKVIQRVGPAASDAIKSGKIEGGKMIVHFPVGIRHVDYFYIPIKDQRGNVYKIIEIFLDQTSLVEQLDESNTLINESPAGIITTDLSGKILSSNKAFQDIVQLSESKLATMSLRDINVIARDGKTFNEIISTKKPGTGTITIDRLCLIIK